MRMLFSILASFLVSVGGSAAAGAEWEPEPLQYVKIVLDEQDRSHFEDVREPFEMQDFAPPAGPVGLAPSRPVSTMVFATSDAAWVGDWHPTPRLQYILVLAGIVDISVEDGETRRFGPGSILYLEDVRGRGHNSEVVSETPALFAIVAVPEVP